MTIINRSSIDDCNMFIVEATCSRNGDDLKSKNSNLQFVSKETVPKTYDVDCYFPVQVSLAENFFLRQTLYLILPMTNFSSLI